jgi:hypothetical protein
MHVENDVVEFGTADDQKYEFQEPLVTDTTDLAPAQGKS